MRETVSRGRYPLRVHVDPPLPEVEERYLLQWEGRNLHHHPETFPALTSPALFGNRRPLELDVGCGTAKFLIARASRHSNTNFLGVDLALRALHLAVHRAARAELTNLRFIRADVRLLYPLLAPLSLQIVHLLYPTPYRRRRHQRRRRLMNAPFLGVVFRALVAGGSLRVKTDDRALLEEMVALIREDGRYRLAFEPEPGGVQAVSYHQQLWESRGKPPLGFVAVKPAVEA